MLIYQHIIELAYFIYPLYLHIAIAYASGRIVARQAPIHNWVQSNDYRFVCTENAGNARTPFLKDTILNKT